MPQSQHRALTTLALVTLASLLAGCQTAATRSEPAAPVEIVFPRPPDEPRFAYERTLFNTANLVQEDSKIRLRQMLTGEGVAGRGFGKPFDVVTCKGRIYVSDTAERMVMAFDIPQRRFFEVGTEEPGALAMPLGLNTDAECNLYVADSSLKKVLVYDRDGKHLRDIGEAEMFARLSHVAPSPDGTRVYAVDTGGVDSQAHRIRVFDGISGEHLHDIGSRGSGPGQLNLPRDVEIGKDGLVYVVDGANFRVQVFDPQGTFVRSFGQVGRQTGQFSRPKGIAIDPEGRIYVSDTAFGNFQIFTPEGQLLLFIGQRGTTPAPATYMLPAGIDVDEDGRVYMVDQFFHKVDIFRPVSLQATDGFLGPWAKPAS